jgi:hypothetical protein
MAKTAAHAARAAVAFALPLSFAEARGRSGAQATDHSGLRA